MAESKSKAATRDSVAKPPARSEHADTNLELAERDAGKLRQDVPEVSPQTEPRPGAQGPEEHQLSVEDIVQRRTPGGDRWPADGRFRWVFHVAKPVVARNVPGAEASSDWSDEDGDMASMHNANKVATLQFALGNGLHPTSEAELDQVLGADDEDALTVDLVYAVDVVPASLQAPEEAAHTYVPSAAVADMGGNTLAERVEKPEAHMGIGRDADEK